MVLGEDTRPLREALGFDYIWLDETEPDVDPAKDFFSVGSGTRYYNIYPLFHTASVYEGFRRDFGDSRSGHVPGACGISWSAAERHSVLVERHHVDLGHVEAVHSCGTRFHRQRYALLGYRHRRLLLAFSSRRLPRGAHAPDRRIRCTGTSAIMRTIRSCSCAGSSGAPSSR